MLSTYSNLKLGSESNSTTVAGANDTVPGTGTRYYTFASLPSTYALYYISGLECLNGTVVNGNFQLGIDSVDASPPVSNFAALLSYTPMTAQSGAEAVQRVNRICGQRIFEGGSLLGLWLGTSSATGRYGTTTVSSANNTKSITQAAGGDVALGTAAVAWTAGTEEIYLKAYFKPLTGI